MRSGTKLKTPVRVQAKHDGRLQQRGDQGRRPVSLFISEPTPLPIGLGSRSQTPLLHFSHTPLKQTGFIGDALRRIFTPAAGGGTGLINSPKITKFTPNPPAPPTTSPLPSPALHPTSWLSKCLLWKSSSGTGLKSVYTLQFLKNNVVWLLVAH